MSRRKEFEEQIAKYARDYNIENYQFSSFLCKPELGGEVWEEKGARV